MQLFLLLLGLTFQLGWGQITLHSEVVRRLEGIPLALATFLGEYRSRNDTDAGESWQDMLCEHDLEQFGAALGRSESWALEMYDSWGKIPSGLLQGNFFTPGSFEQCRRFGIQNSAGLFQGQHCTVQLGITAGSPMIPLWLGICVPDSCEAPFVRNLTNQFAAQSGLAPIGFANQGNFCYRDEPKEQFSGTAISAMVIFGLLAAAVIACTVVDVFGVLFLRPVPAQFREYSLYSNLLAVMKTVPRSLEKSDTIDCVNGIRSVMMLQIVAHHVHDTLRAIPVTNQVARQEYFQSVMGILGFRASALSVDIFLVLSATLLSYGVMRELSKTSKLNVFKLWIHRIVRILPAYGLLIYFVVAFGEHFGEGPLYRYMIQPAVDACSDNWWSAILFIQNYVNPERMCLPYTYYLSIDMQLYLISPLIIYFLWRYGSRSLSGVALLVLLSMTCVFATFLHNDFRLNPPMNPEREFQRARATYYATHARMSVWFCGIAFGFFLFRTRQAQVKWPVWILTAGSITATALTAVINFAVHEIYKPRQAAPVGDAFYEALHRVGWVVCIMWLIFMCVNGYGSLLNDLFSWTFWQPLAKLSYCMYLLHFVVIMVTFGGALRQPFYFSEINLQYVTLGVVGLSVVVSLLWTLFIERPFIALERNVRMWIEAKSKQ
ncbi:hypothetical protein quinque_014595 [Culex quinquefasciatus]